MKVELEQLSMALDKQLYPIYLVSGDEIVLVNAACDLIRDAAKKNGFLEREKITVSPTFDWEGLINGIATASLFSAKRLIEILIPQGNLGDRGSKTLMKLTQRLPSDSLFLIQMGKLNSAQQKSKWFQAIDRIAATLCIRTLNHVRYVKWMDQHIYKHHLLFTQEARAFLLEALEGNLAAAQQTLETLVLLDHKKPIDVHLVQKIIEDSSQYDVFQLVDWALQGEITKVNKVFNRLHLQGCETTLLLWAFTRECRLLINLHQAIRQGCALTQSFQQLGIWSQRRPILQKTLKRLDEKHCIHLLSSAQDIDEMIKGLHPGDPWRALLDRYLTLAGFQVRLSA